MLQSIGYSLLAVKVTVGLLSLLIPLTTTYGMNINPSLDILKHARTVNLRFNQRMLYAHATAPSKEITNAILDQIMSSSSINNQPTSCSRGMKEDRRILQALLYISQGDSDSQCTSTTHTTFHLHVWFFSLIFFDTVHDNTICNTSFQLISPPITPFSQGYLDAAHDIVQSISEQDAVYIHALLHRLEGQYVGEGGMKGTQPGANPDTDPDICTVLVTFLIITSIYKVFPHTFPLSHALSYHIYHISLFL